MRLITEAVLRMRESSKGWLQQTQVFIMLSLKQLVFPSIEKKTCFFFLNIPKICMKRENLFPCKFFNHCIEIPVIDTHKMCIQNWFWQRLTVSLIFITYKISKKNCMLHFHTWCLNDWKSLEQMLNQPFTTCCLLQWGHLQVILWRHLAQLMWVEQGIETVCIGVFNVKLIKTVAISMQETEKMRSYAKFNKYPLFFKLYYEVI